MRRRVFMTKVRHPQAVGVEVMCCAPDLCVTNPRQRECQRCRVSGIEPPPRGRKTRRHARTQFAGVPVRPSRCTNMTRSDRLSTPVCRVCGMRSRCAKHLAVHGAAMRAHENEPTFKVAAKEIAMSHTIQYDMGLRLWVLSGPTGQILQTYFSRAAALQDGMVRRIIESGTELRIRNADGTYASTSRASAVPSASKVPSALDIGASATYA